MLKLLAKVTLVVAITVATVTAVLYWKAQQTIQDNARALKRTVAKDFHDPESARFRAVRLQSHEGRIRDRLELINAKFLWRSTPAKVLSVFSYDPELLQLCGEVNAKNSFGAYVGYKHFVASGGKSPFLSIDDRDNEDYAKRSCEITAENVVYSEPDRD